MHDFVVHSDESACRKSGRLGMDQVISNMHVSVNCDNRSLIEFKEDSK